MLGVFFSQGNMKAQSTYVYVWHKCKTCNGTKKMPCTLCSNGKLDCPYCKGSGTYNNAACNYCSSRGWVGCTGCGGSKDVKGTGQVSCRTCSGQGGQCVYEVPPQYYTECPK
jgi:hypothetical protein